MTAQRSAAADRAAIADLLARYCRGVDRLDLELVRSCYHADGVDHHTGFDGTVDEYVAWLAPALRRLAGTQHLVSTQLIEPAGDEAVAETYGQAVHWGDPPEDPRRNFTSGFRYLDHLQYRGGRWAIRERWAVREWTRSEAGMFVAKEADGPSGRRDADDPLWSLRSRVLGTG